MLNTNKIEKLEENKKMFEDVCSVIGCEPIDLLCYLFIDSKKCKAVGKQGIFDELTNNK